MDESMCDDAIADVAFSEFCQTARFGDPILSIPGFPHHLTNPIWILDIGGMKSGWQLTPASSHSTGNAFWGKRNTGEKRL